MSRRRESPASSNANGALEKGSNELQDKHNKIINNFPHLPPYRNPTTGFLSYLPLPVVPYAQLMRLDKPAGLYAIYLPHIIGIVYAACVSPSSTPLSPLLLLRLAALFVPFNILLRGWACTWNDTLDADFDCLVARCRHRPVARGAVSTAQAHTFTAIQLFLFLLLQYYCFPGPSHLYTLTSLVIYGIYPFLKRFTHYPQLVLGLGIGWSILFSSAVLLGDDMGRQAVYELNASKASLALAASVTIWTVIYDTVYAHQDIADDTKAGVKGMAVKLGERTKILATGLTVIMGVLLVLCGIWSEEIWSETERVQENKLGGVYFAGTVGGVMAAMGNYLYDVDLKNPASCGAWFQKQAWLVGGGYLAGLLGEYILQLQAAGWEYRWTWP
ncbi:UbiA prenyltransferase family-domain-containing protein [Podospora australis]|uniref:Diterpenoid pyrone biosynthesis cluster protein C n=1 Tax=Podospora australis TaxID=1536484 RepID=A0AAN6WNX9_9PEZI|nr:UbiA prenyltransferase family-domain-containing protein [Podospora australis]